MDNADFSDLDGYLKLDPWMKDIIIMTDFKESINQCLESLVTNPSGVRDLNNLIKYTKSTPGAELPKFDVQVLETAAGTKGTTDPEYQQALALESTTQRKAGSWEPCKGGTSTPYPYLLVDGSAFRRSQRVSHYQYSPWILPAGTEVERESSSAFVDVAPSVPFCLSIHGKPFSKEILVRIAYVHEQQSKA